MAEREAEQELVEQQRLEKEQLEDLGSVWRTKGPHGIHCLTIIGQVEGHVEAPQGQKTTKYEHVIPQLAAVQEDPAVEGLLVLLNTQCRRGAGRGALHRHPAGRQRSAQLHRAHSHHDHPPGAPLRHDPGGAPDHAVV